MLSFIGIYKRLRVLLVFGLLLAGVSYVVFLYSFFSQKRNNKVAVRFVFEAKTATITAVESVHLFPEEIVFPNEIGGVRVKRIGDNAIVSNRFLNKKKYISVFDKQAFRVKRVILPCYLEQIGQAAFKGCVNLSKIYFPPSVHLIDKQAFSNCKTIEHIVLPNQLSFIGAHAFRECDALKTFVTRGVNPFYDFSLTQKESDLHHFGSTVQKLTFYRCKNLEFVQLPPLINTLDTAVFYYCQKIRYVFLPSHLKQIYRSAFSHCANLQSMDLPEGCISLSESVFAYCKHLRKVTLPSTLTRIGGAAFLNCTSLIDLKVPKKVVALKNLVFGNCTALQNIILSKNLNYFNYGAFVFAGRQLNLTILQPNAEKITFFNKLTDSDEKYRGIEKITVNSNALKSYQKAMIVGLAQKLVPLNKQELIEKN